MQHPLKITAEINSTQVNMRTAIGGIVAVSIAATLFLFWLIYFKPAPEQFSETLTFLPALNAVLNGLSAISMCAGLFFILRGNWRIHQRFMIGAFAFSTIFLIGYILHHHLHGDTPFRGAGAVRAVYFFILITHVILSVVALPLILTTFFLSLTGRLRLHKRIARLTFPVWLYVSVTGVIVFLLLNAY